MGAYTTMIPTREQYVEIIQTIRNGFLNVRPNNEVATALVVEANLGIRIGDVLDLTLKSIVKDGAKYRLDIVEQKTEKDRNFTVLMPTVNYIKQYCIDNNIKSNEKIFKITTRQVQRILKKAVEYLGYENISTHSFRKFFSTELYRLSGNDLKLVQVVLQHDDIKTTQRYLKITPEDIEKAMQGLNALV